MQDGELAYFDFRTFHLVLSQCAISEITDFRNFMLSFVSYDKAHTGKKIWRHVGWLN